MDNPATSLPDLTRLRGVVAPEILSAAEVASRKLREAGIPHALVGGVAVGAYGYPRTTDGVDFLVGDEAFVKHPGGLVTLRVPLIAVGKVRVDLISIDVSTGEDKQLRPALESPCESEHIPILALTALVYMKLKAGRQKDIADVVELLKRGKMDVQVIDGYLQQQAPDLVHKCERAKEMAAEEE